MAIKKAFLPLMAMLSTTLEANPGVKLKAIFDEVTTMCSAAGAGGAATSISRNDAGEVVAILDYYFKLWLPVSHVDFGAKAGSASGLNTMCKFGVSNWTRQQREFKNGKEALLTSVGAGETAPADIEAEIAKLEAARVTIVDFPVPGLAFQDIDKLLATDASTLDRAVEKYNKAQEQAAADQAAIDAEQAAA